LRAYKLQFTAYKRLADTTCNVDARMIAFLGPNEAGKSSVMQALDWATEAGTALPPILLNRDLTEPPKGPIVQVSYGLEDSDRGLLADLSLDGEVNTFILAKHADGQIRTGLYPAPRRDPAPFEAALGAVATVEQQLVAAESSGSATDATEVKRLLEATKTYVQDTEAVWDGDWDENFDSLISWLREPPPNDEGDEPASDARDSAAADLLSSARDILRAAHPARLARQRLHEHAPKFVLFDQRDRDLVSAYDLADEQVRAAAPPALANLAWIADLNLNDLWSVVASGDRARASTLEVRANKRLQERLGPKWRQEQIDVQFNMDGTNLEVQIVERHPDGAVTPIGERSDGLRIFVALVAFLARREFATPPVLLVDEIETHLHLDAQADLVEVLTSDVDATQVFYTTHSPGCLPRDLGTGLRLVTPDPANRSASLLKNDFWTSKRPGFTPLLFAMGAGAAAFSALRRAVFCEGASDMILLPSLFRAATGLDDIGFQIAQGLSSYNGSAVELEEAAARVAYLLDGDEGGTALRKRLVDMGIPSDRIFQFETDLASEDFVDRARYLEVINELVRGTGSAVPDVMANDLPDGQTVSRSIEEWCTAHSISPPGKTVVVTALVNSPEALRLAPAAAEELRRVHTLLTAALATTGGS
jgi:hypothetical protein